MYFGSSAIRESLKQMSPSRNEEYSAEETVRRRDEALFRALSTPPKRHAEMKLGKKAKPPKERPASKGRVHKGKTKD
jgi:hypothetical protein